MPETSSDYEEEPASQCRASSSSSSSNNPPIINMMALDHRDEESSSPTCSLSLSPSGDGSSSTNSNNNNNPNKTHSFASQMIPRLSQLPTHVWAALQSGQQMQAALNEAIRPVLWDVIILAIISGALVPLARILYNLRYTNKNQRELLVSSSSSSLKQTNASKDVTITESPTFSNDNGKANGTPTTVAEEYATRSTETAGKAPTKNNDDDPFYNHISYVLADTTSQFLRLMILVYMFDAILIATQAMGMDVVHEAYKSATFAKILYTVWLSWRVRSWKRYWIALAVKRPRDRWGKALLWDRLLDVLILVSVLVSIMGLLHLDVGPGLTSIFAFGGVGTLFFSLASKDLASQIVTAMVLSTSDKFHVGEQVKFGDGTTGIVARMGWLTTDIRGYDNITTRIPNASLANLRCANISRENMARVVVNLRFSYQDIDKLPALMADIKTEIAASCPKLITDGSRPFRVLWQDMTSDCVIVIVTAHFQNMKPNGSTYFNNKQEVLFAIHRAVKKNEMHYVLPSYQVATTISHPLSQQQQQQQQQHRPELDSRTPPNESMSSSYPDD